jgi:tyrosinase
MTDQPSDRNFEAKFVEGMDQNYDPITQSLRGYSGNFTNALPEAVYRLLMKNYTPTYNSFASTGFVPGFSLTTYTSLENIHGSIHVFTGRTGPSIGHMTHVPVAAFDPVFWLHHKYELLPPQIES